MESKTTQLMVLALAVIAGMAQVAQPAIITNVVRRGTSANDPPEIAPNPLNEDELCFMDRTHEYNMVPADIVGAQYIKVANNDKVVADYALEVTLSQDATLYLFLDNRLGYGDIPGGDPSLPPDIYAAEMHWIAEMGFTDTGMDIGIDEGGDGDIDQWSSVYTLDVSAETIRLLQQNDPTNPGGRNMYGVAANTLIEGKSPYLTITGELWQEALDSGEVRPMMPEEWDGYMGSLASALGTEPFRRSVFYPAELYYFPGSCRADINGDGNVNSVDLAILESHWMSVCPEPDLNHVDGTPLGSGLVMIWGPENPEPNQPMSSAWLYDYSVDPDLSNVTISTSVKPPKWIPLVSMGLRDISDRVWCWWWFCAQKQAPGVLAWDTTTSIYIKTWELGASAAQPAANTWFREPGFQIRNVKEIFFAEISEWTWEWKEKSIPPPGGKASPGTSWGYWKDLSVSSPVSVPSNKWYTQGLSYKNGKPIGWDEISIEAPSLKLSPLLADNWQHNDTSKKITGFYFWGSFPHSDPTKPGWTKKSLPDIHPYGFHIGIWTNQDAMGNPADIDVFSHPRKMIREYHVQNYDWKYINSDSKGSIFYFSCKLDPSEYVSFTSAGTYWLSIAALYDSPVPLDTYQWGWKTRQSKVNDAVRIKDVDLQWPPSFDQEWVHGEQVTDGSNLSPWDLCFELSAQ